MPASFLRAPSLPRGRTLLAAAALLCLASGGAHAQIVAFSEPFDSADSTATQLEGRFIQNTGAMWSVIPGFQPGLPTLAFWETGDLMFDGVTPFPNKRATFFVESQTGDRNGNPNFPEVPETTTFLTDDGFTMLDASVNWLTGTDGTTPLNIQFAVEGGAGGVPLRTFDQAMLNHMTANGHTVTVTDADTPYDGTSNLLFVAAYNGAPIADNGGYRDANVPMLSGMFHRSQTFGFASQRGENTNNTINIDIVPGMEGHPLAAGFSGEVTVIDPDAQRQRLTRITRPNQTLAASTKVVATTQRVNFGIPVDPVTMEPTDFTGFEGAGYLRGGTVGDVLGGPGPRVYAPATTFDTSALENPRLTIDLGATIGEDFAGPFENKIDADLAGVPFDYLRILIDSDDDQVFETLAEFLPKSNIGDIDFNRMALAIDVNAEIYSTVLGLELQSFEFALPSAANLALRIEVVNNGGVELVAIDNLKIIGDGDPGGVVGDYNGDGMVDAADYTVWRDNLGQPASALGAGRDPLVTDLNVVQADFASWKNAFGGPAVGSTGVPEPSALALLALAAVAGVACRRK
ncbi:hypothetical protein Pla175_36980 [Pirellulimonas nuda]|uniref:Ice-binding protein C-terminal domain-containing protein n=1 Tax=Pirellulimonas nuda TaxID=2528009 RepID=A0A518DFP3_9BACT|nr:PEP-CTERM sorting domain-containing protein [Pirellulimonas nuda]QDU90295.1 hypothetical protein Pla175_36980 [Pirellulimonas nuda]